MRGFCAIGVLSVLSLLGCDGEAASVDGGARDASTGTPVPPPSEPGRHTVEVLETRRIVPSDGLPPEVTPLVSNNNLDVVRHDGRVYLAWRTAPDHFAGPETVIYVVSSADEITWRFEASFALGTDLREPRFLSLGGALFLYVSKLGTNRFSFEPMGVLVSERRADGTWSALEDIGLPAYIAWRTRVERDTPYMTAYFGGEHIYNFDGLPLSVDLLTTADGRAWAPVSPSHRAVYTGGGSEADFTLGDDGTLYGVVRNEAGDDNGWGSMVCRAPASDVSAWSCHVDPKKYDSPLFFWHDGEAYLVARRNVTATGWYDLMSMSGNRTSKTVAYQLDYSNRPKRCSLWRYVQTEDRIAYVLDLPSNGDTCFAAWMTGARADEVVVYDYSSDIDGPDVSWSAGQAGNTYIYRHVLRFTPR